MTLRYSLSLLLSLLMPHLSSGVWPFEIPPSQRTPFSHLGVAHHSSLVATSSLLILYSVLVQQRLPGNHFREITFNVHRGIMGFFTKNPGS